MGRARYLLVAAVALAACGDDSEPDRAEIERALTSDVQEETGTREVRVNCPDDISEGSLCDVTAPGGLEAKLRITSLEAGEIDGEVVPP